MIRSAAGGHLIASAGASQRTPGAAAARIRAAFGRRALFRRRASDSSARRPPAHRAPLRFWALRSARLAAAGRASPHAGLSPPRRRRRSCSAPARLPVRRFLEVQAPEGVALRAEDGARLHHARDQPMVGELVLALHSSEEAAHVPARLHVDHDDVRDLCRAEDHLSRAVRSPRSVTTTARPRASGGRR
jgi:hypothetical protein